MISPMTQAVADAVIASNPKGKPIKAKHSKLIAAALRESAELLVPRGQEHWIAEWTIRRKLLKIANELEEMVNSNE